MLPFDIFAPCSSERIFRPSAAEAAATMGIPGWCRISASAHITLVLGDGRYQLADACACMAYARTCMQLSKHPMRMASCGYAPPDMPSGHLAGIVGSFIGQESHHIGQADVADRAAISIRRLSHVSMVKHCAALPSLSIGVSGHNVAKAIHWSI